MSAHAPAPVVDTQPYTILLDLIDESPSNPRKIYRGVEELAADLVVHGVLQPALVRPSKKAGRFELVFGSRRYRAAKIAELVELPCIVRDLDDAKVLELQVVENCQRQDVHELEEAEGYEQLHHKHKLTVEAIALMVGKSRAAVYARMKLLDLQPDARKAFYAGKLTASTALLLARVPEDLQAKALKDLVHPDYHSEIPSVRQAFQIITTRYMLKLAQAPFDRGDASLVPAAGSCKDCPKRTGNQRELFADVKSADVCTDPSCFDEKRKAHAKALTVKLADKGVTVVAGARTAWGRIDPPKGYVALDHYDYARSGSMRAGEVLNRAKAKGHETAKTIYFDEHGKEVPVVSVAALTTAVKKAGITKKSERPYAAPKPKQKSPADKALDKAFDRMKEQILAAVKSQPAHDALWHVMVDKYVYGPEQKKTMKLKGIALVVAVMDHELEDARYEGLEDKTVELLAKAFKVDLKKIEAEELAKIPAPAAMPGKKPGK